MIKIILLIINCFSFSAFSSVTESDFLKKIDINLNLRQEGIGYYQRNVDKFTNSDNLTSEDLKNIYNFGVNYLAYRDELLNEIKKVQKEINLFNKIVITTKGPTFKKRNLKGSFNYFINPADDEGRELLLQIKMATIYGLMLFDNYQTFIAPYYSHPKIRYLLNRDFPGNDSQFDTLTSNFYSIKQRKLLLKGIQINQDAKEVIKYEGLKVSSFDQYLDQLIETSPTIMHLNETGVIEIKTFTHLLTRFNGLLKYLSRSSTFQTSKLFGNTMGLFKSRNGYMRRFTEEEKNKISDRLKPLDVLLEKTPFRLTDTFIPGYYGHVAIWVGNEAELTELGVWLHPAVIPHHDLIRSGHHIIEALRPGVQINSLDHFLDIDDLVSLRPKNLTLEQKRDYIVTAFSQIGKKYDFNFDVETDNLIVCSEIAYVVFKHIEWPTDRTLGRSTISPDHVAWQAAPDGEFTPVLMYQSGEEVNEDIQEKFMKNITGAEGLRK